MSIDGTRVTPSYEGGIVSYRSSEPLEDHEYAVKLNVSDKAGNIAVKSWKFTVDTIPPTVVIQTMPSSPVKPESVTVKLITSENLRDVPELTFKPPVGSSKEISLEKVGNAWEGKINITSEMGHGTAAFVFSGVGLAGNRGTEITGGQTLEIAYGYLKIGIVSPWANIYIDGNKVATTPYALEIPVRAGKRLIKLENPETKKECKEEYAFKDGKRYTLTGNLHEQTMDVKPSE